MRQQFGGIYYKHQKADNTICFIAGRADSGDFVQVITNNRLYQYDGCAGFRAAKSGIVVDLPQIQGTVHYGPLLPLRTDIMGPFRHLPMQCSHTIYSMAHSLSGSLCIEGKQLNLTGGVGYLEGDRGRSFPKEYLWLHCNHFSQPCSIMAAVAHIPFCGAAFTGCICAIVYGGREYRLATYCGVHIVAATRNCLFLRQGAYRLAVLIEQSHAQPLRAPQAGQMARTIYESNCSRARFRFWDNNHLLFDLQSNHTSFECNWGEGVE